jgi:hypothetical protein
MYFAFSLVTWFSAAKKMAARDCLYGFLKRHPDPSLKQPAATAISLPAGFRKVQLETYSKNLEPLTQKFKFQQHRTFSMDKTISTIPTKVPEVTSRGRRLVKKIVSGKCGQTITVFCCMISSRKIVPQTFTFPWKRM